MSRRSCLISLSSENHQKSDSVNTVGIPIINLSLLLRAQNNTAARTNKESVNVKMFSCFFVNHIKLKQWDVEERALVSRTARRLIERFRHDGSFSSDESVSLPA